MRTVFKCVIAVPVLYLVAWTVAYVGMFLGRGDGLDFNYYFEYLRLAWTFQGGELPTYIWYLSFLLFLPLAATSLFLLTRHQSKKIALTAGS